MDAKNPLQTSGLIAVSGSTVTAATSVGQTPWLALANRGFVVMRPPALTTINETFTGAWWICGPNGEQIDTTGTVTQGLQEAINYACLTGVPLRVYGQGGRSTSVSGDHSTYPSIVFCSQQIVFPPMFFMDIDLEALTIAYIGPVANAVVRFQSCMGCRIRLAGQIVTNGNAPSLMLQPQGTVPVDGSANVITSSRFEFGSMGASAAGSATTQVIFDCRFGSIISNYIHIEEVECAIGGFQNAILAQQAGSVAGTTVFAENEIHAPNIHAFTNVGFLLGGIQLAGVYYGSNYYGNLCNFSSIRGGGAGAAGINCFGNQNVLLVGVINGGEGGLLSGITISNVDVGTGTEGGNSNITICGGINDHTGADYTDGSGRNSAIVNGRVQSPALAVASLPPASATTKNSRMMVTNANATTFASVVAGGGANVVPVYCDGVNWRIG